MYFFGMNLWKIGCKSTVRILKNNIDGKPRDQQRSKNNEQYSVAVLVHGLFEVSWIHTFAPQCTATLSADQSVKNHQNHR